MSTFFHPSHALDTMFTAKGKNSRARTQPAKTQVLYVSFQEGRGYCLGLTGSISPHGYAGA